MPGNALPVADERDGLSAFLAQQRYVLRLAAFGLKDEEARLAPTVSSLSVGGLLKHCTAVEKYWLGLVTGNVEVSGGEDDYEAHFRLGADETLAGAIETYESVAAETEAIVAEISDLGRAVPVPKDVPWFPKDIEA